MRILRFLNLLAGLAVLIAALAIIGAVLIPVLDLVSHFAYPLLIIAVVCFLLSLVLSRRWDGQRVVAGLALIACLAVTGPEFAARLAPKSAPASEARLRVMSYNVFWLNKTPEKARAAIRASGADIVLLIESGGRQRELADGVSDVYPHRAFCPCGLTILSKWPVLDQYGWPPRQFDTTVSWAVIDTPAGRVPVVGVHMHWPTSPGQVIDQANLLKEASQFDSRELIVMGDFNSTSWSGFIRDQDRLLGLERRTRALPTWPARLPWTENWRAPFPLLPIDQVYAGSDWRTLSVRRGPSGGSDHYSVIVDLARRSAR